MQLINGGSSANKITAIRNHTRYQQHTTNQQDKRSANPRSPVEFISVTEANNSKFIFGQGVPVSSMNVSHPPMTPQHEENVRFVNEEWEKVRSELNNKNSQQERKGCVTYIEKHEYHNPDFHPFDLEEFWGEVFLKKVLDTKNSS